jgi:hypothetical protein
MTFLSQVTDYHRADYTVPIDHCPGNPLLAIAMYFLNHGGMQSWQV